MYVGGDGYDQAQQRWLLERLPQASASSWPGSGHFPHLAHPRRFAELLAGTATWATGDRATTSLAMSVRADRLTRVWRAMTTGRGDTLVLALPLVFDGCVDRWLVAKSTWRDTWRASLTLALLVIATVAAVSPP